MFAIWQSIFVLNKWHHRKSVYSGNHKEIYEFLCTIISKMKLDKGYYTALFGVSCIVQEQHNITIYLYMWPTVCK